MKVRLILSSLLAVAISLISPLGLSAQNTSTTKATATKATATPAVQTQDNQNNNIYTEDKLNVTVTPSQPEFILKLKSNPSTGYSWFLRDYNSDLILPIQHTFQKAEDHGLMGAPVYEIWTFKVKPNAFTVPEQTTIRLIYARPWESNDSATQLVFKISIEGKS